MDVTRKWLAPDRGATQDVQQMTEEDWTDRKQLATRRQGDMEVQSERAAQEE